MAIRYHDGSEVAQEDLRTAIMRLAGSGGEIVLRDKKSIKAGDLKESLKLAAGHLVIRAAEGTRPEIAVLLPEKLPWIEIAPRAKLTLIGVSVKVSVVTPADAKPPTTPVTPTLIDCSGNVSFEHCKFSLSGDDRSARVVSSQGLDTRASHCFFEGFDRPIVLSMLPGAAAKVANCLFVRDVVNPVAGWAVTANLQNPPKGKERTLSMDRCTFLGAGLLATEGFSADGPLKVIVSNLAIRTSAVILTTTDAAMLSKAIDWKGKDNSYALNGIAWIVIPPKGLDGMKGGPSDLKSWTDLFKGDVGGRDIAMKFVGGSTITEGQSIEDYAVVQEAGQPPTGADTAKVGPGGKP